VSLGAVTVRDLRVPDWPREFAYTASVPVDDSPIAQHEAGRDAAIEALSRSGCDARDLPPRTSRVPRWPAGFVGSIAHDASLAVAVASRRELAVTVGIDIERHDALDPHDAELVLTAGEREFAGGDPVATTLLWCAKEAAYKAWCTALDIELDAVDPRDIHVTAIAPAACRVDARGALAARVASIGALDGAWHRLDGLVTTLAWKLAPRTRAVFGSHV
jgi:4'-phosphopantetheinyl transferase EntD